MGSSGSSVVKGLTKCINTEKKCSKTSMTSPFDCLDCLYHSLKYSSCPKPCLCSGVCAIFKNTSTICNDCKKGNEFTIKNSLTFSVKVTTVKYGSTLCTEEELDETIDASKCL